MDFKSLISNSFNAFVLDDEKSINDLIKDNYFTESSIIYFITSYLFLLPFSLIGLIWGVKGFIISIIIAILFPLIVYGLILLFSLFIHFGLKVMGSDKEFRVTNNLVFSFSVIYSFSLFILIIAGVPFSFLPFIGPFLIGIPFMGIFYWFIISFTKIMALAHNLSLVKAFWGQFIGGYIFITLILLILFVIIISSITFVGVSSLFEQVLIG